ncbi:MAG: PDZ domain-containing protein [Terracidiphilus sp.]
MKHLLRPLHAIGMGVLVSMGAAVAMAPLSLPAQSRGIIELLQDPSPLLHSSSQGYLGVDLTDVDQEKAQALKLKEVRGAIITLIDHDAPAGQIGLKINDVVLGLNGQTVEGAEQLRRMLREIPAGRKVSLVISRDGNIQTLAVELADRKAMEHEVWNKIGTGGDVFAQAPGMGILTGGGDGSLPGGFHMPFFGSSLNVGAMVEPLTSQMAEYLGVPSGLMIKQVARKSEAATAGLKAFDVILKVGPDAITTLADWERALHANQGKPVQVTVLRDKKQQTLTLQVDSKRHSELEFDDIFPTVDGAMLAEIEPEIGQAFAFDSQAAAQELKDKAEALREQAQTMQHFEITPQQAEEFRKLGEEIKNSLAAENFKIDQKQMDQLKQQMEEFRKSFKPEDFKVDPKQMDELKRQMEEFGKRFPEQFQLNKNQLDELMQQLKTIPALPAIVQPLD